MDYASKVKSPEPAPALTAAAGSMSFPALPVKAESMEHGKTYIWNKWDGRMSCCKLSTHGESLMELDPPDEWYFEDELIGTLHGPILLSSNTKASR